MFTIHENQSKLKMEIIKNLMISIIKCVIYMKVYKLANKVEVDGVEEVVVDVIVDVVELVEEVVVVEKCLPFKINAF